MTLSRQPVLRLLLLLVLWQTPQWLLAGHLHVADRHLAADCEICAQLNGTTAALGASELPLPLALAPNVQPAPSARWSASAPASVACRGPPPLLY